MYPLFFPPQAANTPHVTPAPTCFMKEVDYSDACARYGVDVFRRPCNSCGGGGGDGDDGGDDGGGGGGQWGKSCDCNASSEVALSEDIELIAFQIQLYELGLDTEWIRKQVAFRGMESRERLRYESDAMEKFFVDGVPSSRVLPTGPVTKQLAVTTSRKSPPLQRVGPQRASLPRRESRLRHMETYESSENVAVKKATQGEGMLMMLGKLRLADEEKKNIGSQEPVLTKRANRRRRGRNRAAYP